MMPSDAARSTPPGTSVLVQHYPTLREVSLRVEAAAETSPARFRPSFALPEWDDAFAPLLEPARLSLHDLGAYRGTPLSLLHLGADPATHTTKSVASYLIALRAVDHIRRTGERVWLVTPSSGNKATALRAAVARAHACRLASPRELGIVSLVPRASLPKMRRDPLAGDDRRALNPLVAWSGSPLQAVKGAAEAFVDEVAAEVYARSGVRLWYSLDLRNYRMADVARALFLADQPSIRERPALTHAHAVSSGYGLLGYQWGHDHLRAKGVELPHPRYFLVQHLATPDLVQYWRTGDFTPIDAGAYRWDADEGIWCQDAIPSLPQRTWSLEENIDSTFYTHRPGTAEEMVGLIRSQGGGGVVVSLAECYARYGRARAALTRGGLDLLPGDPRQLREHAALMGLTGIFEALDRGLLPAGEPVLLHHSGSYRRDDYPPFEPRQLHRASGATLGGLVSGLAEWARVRL